MSSAACLMSIPHFIGRFFDHMSVICFLDVDTGLPIVYTLNLPDRQAVVVGYQWYGTVTTRCPSILSS